MLGAQFLDDRGPGGGLVSDQRAARERFQRGRDLDRETVREGGHGIGRHEPGHLPVARDRVLARRRLGQEPPRPLGIDGGGHARDGGRTPEPESRQIGEAEPPQTSRQVAQRIGAGVAIGGRVRSAPASDPIGDEDDDATHVRSIADLRRNSRTS